MLRTWGRRAVLTILLAAATASASAEGKLRIEGERLIYDTEAAVDGQSEGIESEDIDPFLAALRGQDGITTVQLNSGGGSVWAAHRIKDIIIDFGLNTHVHGDCDSSCVVIFLAGEKRTMSRGSRLGFHQYYWSPQAIEEYYESERDYEGWTSPFDFASWVYEDTQLEVYETLKYMIERGVNPGFAVETLHQPGDGMWRPYRLMLQGAGVLTE